MDTATDQPLEVLTVETQVVGCDGGGGPLGHPRVYLNLGADGTVECPYCSRRFVLDRSAAGGGAPRAGH